VNKLKNKVEHILELFPSTRNSDDALYAEVITQINPDVANLPFITVLNNRKRYDLPNMESVSRARRKICETRPDLRGNDTVEMARAELERDFRAWALEVDDGK